MMSDQVIHEVRICEILRKNPHPNIIQYLGCVVKDDKIHGLCFTKYSMDLMRRVKDGRPLDSELYLRSLKSAILHLHTLGLVHNDINPRNIMINENDIPIIIDFDSCKHEGERLDKSGTPGWCIEDAQYAMRENDFFSFALVENLVLSKSKGI
jgi:serine/threonine protein kinase